MPNFITTIINGAFNYKGITELRLSEGLKFIGSHAFRDNNINTVVIPSTTEFIGDAAFRGNKNLVTVTRVKNGNRIVEFNENSFKVLGSKIIIIDKLFSEDG